jgi:Fe-S oxidoreductase
LPVRYAIGIAVTVVAFAIAGHRFYRLYRLAVAGRPDAARFQHPSVDAELTDVGAQRKLFKRTVSGTAHAFVFWGFTILLFTILEAYGDLFDKRFFVPAIGRGRALGFIEDFFAVAVLLGLIVFSIIRVLNSPERRARKSRFYGSHTRAAWGVLGMIALVILTLIGYRGAQENTGDFPYGKSWWPFASRAVGALFSHFSRATNGHLESILLVANIIVIMGFLVFLSYSKHLHIATAPLNVLWSRRPRALGPLYSTPDMDMENVDEDTVFGAGHIEDLSWKQLLDLYSCTECGRCQDACPAWTTGKPLSPKLLIMALRDNLFESAPRLLPTKVPFGGIKKAATNGEADGGGTKTAAELKAEAPALVPGTIEPDVLWSCLTCGACVEQCPVDIEHVDTIVDMRRYQVLMESEFPSEAGLMLRNIENQGDPWGLGASKRTDWTAALDFEVPVVEDEIPEEIEYLYWVGCAGALDERARKATQSTARMLHMAGVKFAILGPRESCTGDPARRLGNEYLYQETAKANIETLTEVKARKVIASCPHCFNSLGREYPALGGNFEVIHHSQLLARLVADGKLHPGEYEAKVTYHDPCYLGRHNRVFDEPRDVLGSITGVDQIEMKRCREKSFCCGAGGSRMWMEETIGERVNLHRTDEALSTGADVVSTACPYCLIMLDDAVKARQREDDVKVLDISQVMEASMLKSAGVVATTED